MKHTERSTASWPVRVGAILAALALAGACAGAHVGDQATGPGGGASESYGGSTLGPPASSSGTGATTAGGPGGQAADTGPQVQIVNEPGQMIALEQVLVPGKVTVVEFYADWCGACKVMEQKLVEQIRDEPRIVVRKINIVDDTTEVARHYDVGTLPHFRIYRPNGELAYVLIGNESQRSAELARESLGAIQ